MKKKYTKPVVETEVILERVALACSKTADGQGDCSSTFPAALQNS